MKIKFINAVIVTNNENNDILKNATMCIENGNIVAIFGDKDNNIDDYQNNNLNNNNLINHTVISNDYLNCINKNVNNAEINLDINDTKRNNKENILTVAEDFIADEIIDVQGDILMPGFINANASSATVLFRGLNDEMDLNQCRYDVLPWLERKLTAEDIYYGTLLASLQSVQSGITTIVDSYHHPQEIINALKRVGMRAFVPVVYDLKDNGDRYNYLTQNKKQNAGCFNDTQQEIAYCHSVNQQSAEQIEDTIKYARENNLISMINCSQNLLDVGECANINNQLSPVSYLERLGFFDNPAIISHAVCVDKDDISILSQYDVSVVTNSGSNLKLGNGIAPLQSMLQQKINVCIGTSDCISNNSIDFFREMYLTATLQKGILNDSTVLPAQEVLKMATVNGAKALGLKNVGMIAPNYKADIIRLNAKSLSLTPTHNIISNIVYSASKLDVVMTMINGNIVYQNGKWTNIDNIEEIVQKCIEIAKKFKL